MQSDYSGSDNSIYLDFELEIGMRAGSIYPVSVIHSPAGETREKMEFPFTELELESYLKDLEIALLRSGGMFRKVLSAEEEAVQNFGQALFNALLTGQIPSLYDVSKREAANQNKGLRLKLRIEAPELAALPWEFSFDSRQGEYVCLSRNTPIIRYIELSQPTNRIFVTPPLRILGMIASPVDLPPLNVVREKQRINEAVMDLQKKGLIELVWMEGQTWRDLQKAMRQGPWHVFHFIGHGGFNKITDEGLIALTEENGKSNFMSATKLGRLLADEYPLRLVILNSCEGAKCSQNDILSSTAATLVRRSIPCVLAMQYKISDRAAIEFARTFYEALTDLMPIDAAVAEARKAIDQSVSFTMEWGIPVLYMRSTDGILFDIAKTQKPVHARTPFETMKQPSVSKQFEIAEDSQSELTLLKPAGLPDPSWSTEKLIAATKDKHMLVRSTAIMLLSKREPSESLDALIEALKDEEYLVKSNAMVSIAAYGKQVSDRMIQALSDPNQDVRAGAAWVMGELKDPKAIDALEIVAKDDYPLARIQAKASLMAIGRGS
jgi:hypothetical protein